jgi:pimeloyl-ACP methyl ester carboxylesterase
LKHPQEEFVVSQVLSSSTQTRAARASAPGETASNRRRAGATLSRLAGAISHASRRLSWQAGSLLFPVATSRALERLWFSPPRARSTPDGLRLLDTARTEWALVTGQGASRRVRVYRWGSKGPVVLLAHGWGGEAGQWHAVVSGLLAAGMRVVAFDALSHGASDAGARGQDQSSIIEMARSLLAVAWHVGPVHAVVAHSMGGAATAHAIREGLPVRGVVMLGSPADMHSACSTLAWQLGVAPHVLTRMERRSEQWLGTRWSTFNVPDVGRTRPVPPALVIHDREDKEVRWEDGAAIAGAWPAARLVTTQGLGHRRILRDATVIDHIAGFVNDLQAVPPVHRMTSARTSPATMI